MNGDVRPVELGKPLLFIATEEHASDPGTRARVFSGKELKYHYVVIRGSDHMSFTDARLIESHSLQRFSSGRQFSGECIVSSRNNQIPCRGVSWKYLKDDVAPNLDLAVRVDKK